MRLVTFEQAGVRQVGVELADDVIANVTAGTGGVVATMMDLLKMGDAGTAAATSVRRSPCSARAGRARWLSRGVAATRTPLLAAAVRPAATCSQRRLVALRGGAGGGACFALRCAQPRLQPSAC